MKAENEKKNLKLCRVYDYSLDGADLRVSKRHHVCKNK